MTEVFQTQLISKWGSSVTIIPTIGPAQRHPEPPESDGEWRGGDLVLGGSGGALVHVWHSDADAAVGLAARLMRVQPRIQAIPINNAVPDHAHVIVAAPSRIQAAAETVLMLRVQAPRAVLVVAIPRPEVETTIAVVLAGAAGVVDLNSSDETLAHSLDTVMTDGAYVPGPFQASVLAALAERRRNAARNRERLASLSPRERCVLELLKSGQDRAAIAERLQVSPHRVRATIDRAKAKLGASTQRQAVAFFGDRLTSER